MYQARSDGWIPSGVDTVDTVLTTESELTAVRSVFRSRARWVRVVWQEAESRLVVERERNQTRSCVTFTSHRGLVLGRPFALCSALISSHLISFSGQLTRPGPGLTLAVVQTRRALRHPPVPTTFFNREARPRSTRKPCWIIDLPLSQC